MSTDDAAAVRLRDALAAMGPRDWLRAGVVALLTWLVLGIPADIVENPIFGRPIPVRAIDHVILVASAVLTGVIFGVRSPGVDHGDDVADSAERSLLAGGLLTFFAVGCPVCNRFVVTLVGTSGALSWFRPIQPLLGAAALALLGVALRRRLRDLARGECAVASAPVPALGGFDRPEGDR